MSSTAADEQPLLSIIVVFWNGREDAPPFMAALERCRSGLSFPFEVIAVDNASSDGTAEWIEAQAPWVRLIRNEENLGFAAGCNAGLRASRGSMLLLLNPDCEANPEALADVVDVLRRHRRIGMAACRLLHPDGSSQPNAYDEPGPLSYLLTHSLLSPVFFKLRRLAPSGGGSGLLRVDWLMGACLATRRDVVDRIGMMEEDYFLYSEDTDWCRRARDAGYAVVLSTRTALQHRQGTSAAKRPDFTFRQVFRSLLRYSRRHHAAARRFSLSAMIVADMMVRLPLYGVLGRFERARSAVFVIRMMARQDPDC